MKKRRKWMKLDASLARMAQHPAPLFLRPKGRSAPCDAHIRINPRSRRIDAVVESRAARTATLERYRGNVVLIPVSPYVSGQALFAFCKSHSVQALMRRICDGWTVTVDARGKFQGMPDDVAADALIALLERSQRDLRADPPPCQLSLGWADGEDGSDASTEDEPHDTCADVRLWFGAALLADLWPDGIPLESAVERLYEEARSEGVFFEYARDGIEDALMDLAGLQLQDCPETLSAHHVRELLRAEFFTNRDAQRWCELTMRTL